MSFDRAPAGRKTAGWTSRLLRHVTGPGAATLVLLLWPARILCWPQAEGALAERPERYDVDPEDRSPFWPDPVLSLTGDPGGAAGLEYEFEAAPLVRRFSGHVAVRENAVQGTRLDLNHDLGLRTGAGANLHFQMDGPEFRFQMELEEVYAWGGHPQRAPFNWNGTVFLPPAQVRDDASFLTLLPTFVWKAFRSPEEHAWSGPVLGLEYPYYTVSVSTSSTKGSLEDWVHYLPYPVLGAAGHLDLSPSLALEGRVTAGYLPNIPVPYTEGGRLSVSARPSVRLEVPLRWTLGAAWDLSLAFTYQYWSGRDHSNEDGNTLTFSSAGLWLGLAYRW